jgi:putative ubiquitin-RnfH superfamily antitoxin RatB of RatAB toxin-antitoxin module
MGIFGKLLAEPCRHVLAAGDRVEIYRPLEANPRQARKARAKQLAARPSG